MTKVKTQTGIVGAARLAAMLLLAAPLLSACGANLFSFADLSHINNKTKFSSSKYGVAASPRLTTSSNVPKGGGRYQVGKPYKVAGKWYTPKEDPGYTATGMASWYGPNFHGRQTANGEIFDQYALTGAHPTLPLPSYVRVTNLDNRNSVIVRINDRGPYAHGRVIDLSKRTAEVLDFKQDGTAKVRVQYVGRAPLEGDDTRILMASLNAPSPLEGSGYSDTRVALLDNPRPQISSANTSSSRINLAQIQAPIPQLTFTRQRLSDIPVSSQPIRNAAGSVLGFASSVSTAGLNALFYAPPEQFATPQLNETFGSAASATQELVDGSLAFVAREVDIGLGIFSDDETINQVSLAFALLGAVEKVTLRLNERDVTQLKLRYLKPGVLKADVLDLGQEMGVVFNPADFNKTFVN